MKTKTLFDHIKQVTNVQNQLYWDNITDADKKTWSNYMVHRFLSMKAEWIEVVNEIQQYWELKPKSVYQFYTNLLPRGVATAGWADAVPADPPFICGTTVLVPDPAC